MKEKKTKMFTIDGKNYKFNHEMFQEAYMFQLGQIRKDYKKNKGQTVTEQSFREDMAAKICASPDAIKKWRYGINSPGSVEIIADIEKYLQVEKNSLLVDVIDDLKENEVMTNRAIPDFERNAVRTIYKQMAKLIKAFYNTDGRQFFTDIVFGSENFHTDRIWLMDQKMFSYDEYIEIENDTYDIFRENMIDIPENIYTKLFKLYVNITGGIDERFTNSIEGDSWYTLYLEEYCEEHYSDKDVYGNTYVASKCISDLTNGWYQEIREILKDYIPA